MWDAFAQFHSTIECRSIFTEGTLKSSLTTTCIDQSRVGTVERSPFGSAWISF